MVRHASGREYHGETKTPLWSVWNQMLCRCYAEGSQAYRWYGARGIRVCDAWRCYTGFRGWALASGYQAGLSLDRKDSDGDYCPQNCQWIPQPENARKCRNTHWFVEAFGETKTIGEWLKDERSAPGLKESAVRNRLARGWDPVDAITLGPRGYRASFFSG